MFKYYSPTRLYANTITPVYHTLREKPSVEPTGTEPDSAEGTPDGAAPTCAGKASLESMRVSWVSLDMTPNPQGAAAWV